MSASGYTPWSVTAGEIPTTAYWNLLGANDASFNNGNGFNDGAIVARHISASAFGAIYPVGAIYIETTGVNPATTFGIGTWVAIQGRTLVGAGTSDATYTAGTTGGASTHQHFTLFSNDGGAFYSTVSGTAINGSTPGTRVLAANHWNTGTGSTGGNTRQDATYDASSWGPYLVVYIWQRTA